MHASPPHRLHRPRAPSIGRRRSYASAGLSHLVDTRRFLSARLRRDNKCGDVSRYTPRLQVCQLWPGTPFISGAFVSPPLRAHDAGPYVSISARALATGGRNQLQWRRKIMYCYASRMFVFVTYLKRHRKYAFIHF